MRLLYLSCHSILEYDELKIFEDIGVDYFSLGSYLVPTNPVDTIRPALTHHVHPQLVEQAPLRDELTEEFVKPFDVILISHVPEWIERNWNVIKHKRVIWRSIGQSTPQIEKRLEPYRMQGMEVVRYSPYEQNIGGNIGVDVIIRFGKDPQEYSGWTGVQKQVITIGQDIKHRGEYCHYNAIMDTFRMLPSTIYGNKNEGGYLTYEDMKQVLRDNRVFFYTGTQPASYTLSFIEAMMIGIPIVALGDSFKQLTREIAGDVYEVPSIIQTGVNGYVVDTIYHAKQVTQQLLDDKKLANRISHFGRETALKLFSTEIIKNQWRGYLYGK